MKEENLQLNYLKKMKLLSIDLDILHHDRSTTTDSSLTAEERLKAKFGENGLAHQVNELVLLL